MSSGSKIVFLQSKRVWVDLIGVMYLSTALKRAGHSVAVRFVESKREVDHVVKIEKPDIAAFSVTTGLHHWAVKIAEHIKKVTPQVITVVGGHHATYLPEIALEPSIDFAIRGEAEEAFVRFIDAVPIENPEKLPNLAWAQNGSLKTTDLLPLVVDLDSLGMPDRDLYPTNYKYFAWNPAKMFLTSRGCPFNCLYCYGSLFKKLYTGKGPVLRFRSHEAILDELKTTRQKYNLPIITFEDSTFNADKKWLLEFLVKYGHEIDLPFNCQLRIELVDKETAQALARSGCFRACIGVETGSEKLRKMIGKSISNDDIRHGVTYLKESGIKIEASVMFGIPEETTAEALHTIQFLRELGTEFSRVSLFQPYPNLKLTEKAVQLQLVDPYDFDKIENSLYKSILKSENINILVNIQKLIYLFIKFPKLDKLLKVLIKFPPNPIFKLIYILFYLNNIYSQSNISLLDFFYYAWANRKYQN